MRAGVSMPNWPQDHITTYTPFQNVSKVNQMNLQNCIYVPGHNASHHLYFIKAPIEEVAQRTVTCEYDGGHDGNGWEGIGAEGRPQAYGEGFVCTLHLMLPASG